MENNQVITNTIIHKVGIKIKPLKINQFLPKFLPWLIPVILLFLWQLSTQNNWLSSQELPSPFAVLSAGYNLAKSGELFHQLAASTWRAVIGFAIGGSFGFALGLLTGLSDFASRLLDTTLQMVRNIPHLALIPLIIIWLGIGETSKIFLVAFGSVFPIYLNTFHGVRHIDKDLLEMARSYGLKRTALFWHVILPGALPSILVGVRFSLGLMWLTLIVAETISADSGIGYLSMNAREFFQTDIIVLTIILYAILGKIADLITKSLEHLCLRWHPSYQKGRE